MSEEKTQNITDGRSFEERVFARFDALDARLDNFDSRLEAVEVRLDTVDTRLLIIENNAERRALETKPIWERALAEILELKESFADFDRKIDVLSHDIVKVRADQVRVERRVDKLEPKPAQ